MAVEKSDGGGGGASVSSSTASTMDRFHKIVLSWDYLRLVTDSKVCANPVHPLRQLKFEPRPDLACLVAQGEKRRGELKPVKNTYKSVAEYLGIFEPLLFEEVKVQIVRGRSDQEDEGEGWAWLLLSNFAVRLV
jgi:senataxin